MKENKLRPCLTLRQAALWQLAVVFLLLWLSRFLFYSCNSDVVGEMTGGELMRASVRGLRFDLSVFAYFNALYVLLRFLPLRGLERRGWIVAGNVYFTLSNSLLLIINVADTAFFRFSGSRMRWHGFLEMWEDSNMGTIIFSYWGDYRWAYLLSALAVVIVAAVAFLPKIRKGKRVHTRGPVAFRWGVFVLAGGLTFCAMRGNLASGSRALSISDAVYPDMAEKVNVVLNSPFCILRSMSGDNRLSPVAYYTGKELADLRTSLHPATGPGRLAGKNVMYILVESGAQLWLDSQRVCEVEERHRGLMPFLDSIARKSLSVRNAFATGVKSIGGVTAVFGGFPAFGSFTFLTSPYNSIAIDTPGRILMEDGYCSKGYFGGNRGSYGIASFLRYVGFDEVLERGDAGVPEGYDGQWGIWDSEMAEFIARDLTTLRQPFVGAWFTLKPHGPWNVPEDYENAAFRSAPGSMERVVEYEDMALRRFFENARRQPWYSNTLFVITGDHGCRDLPSTPYATDNLQPRVMMLFFTPDGSLEPGVVDAVMGQCDLSPTLMGLLGSRRPYVALGRDVLLEKDGYALSCLHDTFQIHGSDMMVETDMGLGKVMAVYDTGRDPELRSPLPEGRYDAAEVERMLVYARAFMQDYVERLTGGRMSAGR